MADKVDVYQVVTDQIIEALEKGVVAWQKPWTSLGGPKNLQSKRPYRGMNAFLLALSPYKSPYWTTFNACKKAGGTVKKGEKGTLVVFWRILTVDDSTTKSGTKKIPLLRYYKVFNVEQCEGLKVPESNLPEFDPIEEAQTIIDEMPDAPTIEHGGDRAYYVPLTDDVQLPFPEVFDTPADYYATAYHELVHSTGHASRLGRVTDWSTFGSDPYAKEELVAEMGAAFLAGFAGIEPRYEANAAYLNSWINKLKQDKKLLIQAASQAQKAADYILGNAPQVEAEETEAAVA